jgi:hypothetical protein
LDIVIWIVGGAIAFFVAWWAIKIGLSMAVPPEVSGKALLKQELKRHGVDVARIPDRALDEIVQYCLSGARGMAIMNQLATHGRAEDKNWRANLVRQLQVHVPLIQNIIAGGRPSPVDEKIREILVRNGVVHS